MKKTLKTLLLLLFCVVGQMLNAQSTPPLSESKVLADTYVRDGTSYAGNNYGSESTLHVKKIVGSTPGYHREIYLKFSLDDLDQVNLDTEDVQILASMYLAQTNATISSVKWNMYPVSNILWGEASITWNNRPAVTNQLISQVQGRVRDTSLGSDFNETNVVEFDITSYAISEYKRGNKTISLNINNDIHPASTSTYDSQFASKENTNPLMHPKLVIKEVPPITLVKSTHNFEYKQKQGELFYTDLFNVKNDEAIVIESATPENDLVSITLENNKIKYLFKEGASGSVKVTFNVKVNGDAKSFDIVFLRYKEPQAVNFAAISDIHVGRSGWEPKLDRAFATLLAQTPKLDAIFITGDITDGGTQAEYDLLKTKIAAKIPTDIPVYYCMGNHDWWDSAANCGNRFVNTLGQDLNQFIDIKGYPFIMISMESKDQTNSYLTKTKAFLAEKLASAAAQYPNKPIFVFQHVPNAGTVYGSYKIGGNDSWGTDNIIDILNSYPQVVAISGHSHYFLADERSIHQKNFTSINDGSVTYAETEIGYSSGGGTNNIRPFSNEIIQEGCIISIDELKDVSVKRLDLAKNVEIKQPWSIKTPHDGSKFLYANRTGGSSPYFNVTDKIALSDISENACNIQFPIAKDDDDVQQYKIEVLNTSMQALTAPVYRLLSRFYLRTADAYESTMSWKIDGLRPGTEYYIRVTALDAFANESAPPLVSDKFTTIAVVAPVANLLDVKFSPEGNAVDVSPSNFTIGKGPGKAVSTLYDPEIQQHISSFTRGAIATTDTYFKVDYKNNTAFKSKLSAAFTLDIYTRTKGSEEMSSVSSLQAGGFGMEQVAGGGATQIWFSVTPSGTVKVGKKSLYSATNPQYAHTTVTYDGETINVYNNGQLDDTAKSSKKLRFSNTPDAHWICIGGDANAPSDKAQGAFSGEIALVRMFDKAITANEVTALYKEIEDRKKLESVDILNNLITSVLPSIRNAQSQTFSYLPQIDALLAEGWELMNSMATTDPEIQAYKLKTDVLLKEINGSTGIGSENNGKQIKIYPTVVSRGENIYIEMPIENSQFDKSSVEVYNMQGLLVLNAQLAGERTAISAPSVSGTYIIKVRTENANKKLKLLVK